MTTGYTSLLNLRQPQTGTESGTWGDDINNALTAYLDIAIAGTLVFTGDGSVTLANTSGSNSSTGITGTSAQYMVLQFTGTLTGTKVVTGPSSSKVYLIDNATTGGYGVTIKSASSSGYTVAAGTRALVYYNGTDYVQVSTNDLSKLIGSVLIANGGTNSSATPTAGAVAYGTGTAYAFTPAGVTGQVLTSNGSSAPTWTSLPSGGVASFSAGSTGFSPSTASGGVVVLSGTLNTTNGGTGLTSFNSGGLMYASDSGTLATANYLTYDGTNLGVGTSTPLAITGYTVLTLNNSTYGGVLYLQANGTNIGRLLGNSSSLILGTLSTTPILFQIGGSGEAARFDTAGNFLVGQTTSAFSNSGVQITGGYVVANGYKSHNGITGSTWQNYFNLYWTGSSTQLWIDTVNQGTITVSSDYRIKQNVQTQTATALNRIAQMRPVTYQYQDNAQLGWKADGVSREGFIAHELQAIVPSAVEGEKDSPNQVQSLKLDALCSVMVKAIQELSAKVATLEAKLGINN
jgi:Chaperone of endosialidase